MLCAKFGARIAQEITYLWPAFFASCVSVFEGMHHLRLLIAGANQRYPFFLVFQLVAFIQQAKVRVKTAVKRKLKISLQLNMLQQLHYKLL